MEQWIIEVRWCPLLSPSSVLAGKVHYLVVPERTNIENVQQMLSRIMAAV